MEMCFVLMRELEAHSSEKTVVFKVLEGVFVEKILYLVGEGKVPLGFARGPFVFTNVLCTSSGVRSCTSSGVERWIAGVGCGASSGVGCSTSSGVEMYWSYLSLSILLNLEVVIFQFDGDQRIEADERATVLSWVVIIAFQKTTISEVMSELEIQLYRCMGVRIERAGSWVNHLWKKWSEKKTTCQMWQVVSIFKIYILTPGTPSKSCAPPPILCCRVDMWCCIHLYKGEEYFFRKSTIMWIIFFPFVM